jgi:PAS domain S-box-containing protein
MPSDSGDALRLLHELQVHQIELEMQNELRETQKELADSNARFVDLYDFAPVGYCTIDDREAILEANLTLARLLGRPRNTLTNQRLSQYILAADRAVFSAFGLRALAAGTTAPDTGFAGAKTVDASAGEGTRTHRSADCELRLVRPDGSLFWTHWTAMADSDRGQDDTCGTIGDSAHRSRPVLRLAITDIDARKRAEASMHASEHFASAAADNTPGMLGYWDRDLRCRFANRHYLEWFGRSAQQMQGIRIQDMQGETLFALNEPFIRAALQGEAQQFERQIVKPDGQIGHTWAQYVPHRVNGEVQGFFALVTDVTALRTSQARQRVGAAALGAVSQGVLISGPDRHTLSVNDAFLAITGYSEAEVLGRDGQFLQGPDTDPRVVDDIRHALHGAKAFAGELLNYRKDGTAFWNELTISPVFDALGALSHFVSVTRDITERKQAQAALARSAELLDRTGELAGVGGWGLDLQTMKLSWTRQTFRIAEIEPPVPPSLEAGIRLFAAEAQPVIAAAVQAAIDAGTPYDLELPLNTARGRPCWVRTQGFAEFVNGKVVRIFGTLQDITADRLRKAELDLHRDHLEDLVARRTADLAVAREQAEAANRAKSAFLANMSHEIRTPLSTILGLSYLLGRISPTPEQQARLVQIDNASEHLLGIINDVLDLSKIEASHLQLENIDFDLRAVFEAVHAIIAEPAGRKGLAVEIDCAQVPRWLKGDPTRLRQCLLNLAANAVKFTDCGRIALRAQWLDRQDDSLLVQFSVQDTGPGISAEQQQRLFQAFEQGDATTARRHGGTGLGLAITQQLAQLMGGQAGVDRPPGGGSNFWFTARLRPASDASRGVRVPAKKDSANPEALLRRQHGNARILLADDNEVSREVTQALLQGVGLVADTATNGLEALQLARAGSYDLMLMDMQMPELDGLGATRAIRGLPGCQGTPILALTANAFPEDRQACAEAGMTDFIARPIRVDAFYAALLRALAGGTSGPLASSLAQVAGNGETALGTQFDEPAQSTLTRLAALPGLDVAGSLKLWKGRTDKYLQLLRTFADHHTQDMAKLAAKLAANNPTAARHLTHTLLGAAASLGFHDIASAARRLDGALRTEPSGRRLPAKLALDMESIDAGFAALAAVLAPDEGGR